jgi:predicted nucleotidyltransferase
VKCKRKEIRLYSPAAAEDDAHEVRQRELRLDAQRTIQDIVRRLAAEYAPEKIILFGSHAAGEPDESSDIDLLIIKNTSKRPLDRWVEVKRILRDRNRMISVSPLVYTEAEIRERLAIKDFFIQEILEGGRVLYG